MTILDRNPNLVACSLQSIARTQSYFQSNENSSHDPECDEKKFDSNLRKQFNKTHKAIALNF